MDFLVCWYFRRRLLRCRPWCGNACSSTTDPDPGDVVGRSGPPDLVETGEKVCSHEAVQFGRAVDIRWVGWTYR
jgi:hypothetical protein